MSAVLPSWPASAAPDRPRGVPSRPSAPTGLRQGRGVRPAARGAAEASFPSPYLRVRAQGRGLDRGVGARDAHVLLGRGPARDGERAPRGGPHPRRSGGDRADRPHPGRRARRAGRDRAGPRWRGPAPDRREAVRGGGVLPRPPASAPSRSHEPGHETPSKCRSAEGASGHRALRGARCARHPCPHGRHHPPGRPSPEAAGLRGGGAAGGRATRWVRDRPRRPAERAAAHRGSGRPRSHVPAGGRTDPRVDRSGARSGGGASRSPARPGRWFGGLAGQGVSFPLSHFPREPGVKGGEMEGTVELTEKDAATSPVGEPFADGYDEDIGRVLVTREQLQAKLRELGDQITGDYQNRDLLLVAVLKGAFMVMADLARDIHLPVDFDFMAVASYGAATQTSGVVRILKDLDRDIEGRHVLLVEDIVDSGLTLNYLLKNLRSRRPATLEVCALLYKPEQLKADIEVKYVGFDIPSVFVVGYGLDYAERYRNLPFVATLKPEVYRGR